MQNILIQAQSYFNIFLTSIEKYIPAGLSRNSIANIGLPDFSTTSLIFIFIAIAVFLVGLTFGKSRVLIALLSMYVARVIEINFAYYPELSGVAKTVDAGLLRVGVFLIIFMITFLLIQRSSLHARLSMAEASIVSVAFLSILEIGFLLSILLGYALPKDLYRTIPSNLLPYFATKTAQFWWAVAPIIALIFIKNRD